MAVLPCAHGMVDRDNGVADNKEAVMKLYIKRSKQASGVDAYCLVDEDGETLPHQVTTNLRSAADEIPSFTVQFVAGEAGLQVIDDRDD